MASFARNLIASGFATLLILSSNLYLYSAPNPQQEIISEVFCWTLILIIGIVYFHVLPNTRPATTSFLGLNYFALCVALLCLSESFEIVNWFSAPLLIPIVQLIQCLPGAYNQLPTIEKQQFQLHKINKRLLRLIAFLTFLAGVSVTLLAFGDQFFADFNLQTCWLGSQIGLYLVLHRGVPNIGASQESSIHHYVLHSATEIARLVLASIVPLAIIWWRYITSVSELWAVVLFKVIRWLAVLTLACDSKLSILPLSTTFAVSTNAIGTYVFDIFDYQSAAVTILAVVCLFLAAAIGGRHRVLRLAILAFAIFPIRGLPTTEQSFVRPLDPEPLAPHSKPYHGSKGSHQSNKGQQLEEDHESGSKHHPIYRLAEEARAKFEATLNSQSRSLSEAVSEYRHRYGREPPPGFDKWYGFATINNVSFIDEYDYMTHSVDPYWQVTPANLRYYADSALSVSERTLGILEIKNHKSRTEDIGFQNEQLEELLEPVLKFLPDMKVLLNNLDEPRVIVPHDDLDRPHSSQASDAAKLASSDYKVGSARFVDLSNQNIFDTAVLSCPLDSPARSPLVETYQNNAAIPFISNVTAARDICNDPPWVAYQHGFLSTPSSAIITHQRVPIASTAKISSFQDIIIPSSYYFQNDIKGYDESWDPSWIGKDDVVYWRGSGTGGQWCDGSWRNGHRQRFVSFTSNPKQEIHLMSQPKPNEPWTVFKSTMEKLITYFEVNFSGFKQCGGDRAACSDQKKLFHVAPTDSLEDSYKHKILYNIDGNSFSGRYYRFLKSNSLVFMENKFREWHDDRLIPWVHYVPISLGMQELPETARYLLDDPEGKVIAARIARESQAWAKKVLRPTDLSAAYLRIFLEYSRLFRDDRGTVKYNS